MLDETSGSVSSNEGGVDREEEVGESAECSRGEAQGQRKGQSRFTVGGGRKTVKRRVEEEYSDSEKDTEGSDEGGNEQRRDNSDCSGGEVRKDGVRGKRVLVMARSGRVGVVRKGLKEVGTSRMVRKYSKGAKDCDRNYADAVKRAEAKSNFTTHLGDKGSGSEEEEGSSDGGGRDRLNLVGGHMGKHDSGKKGRASALRGQVGGKGKGRGNLIQQRGKQERVSRLVDEDSSDSDEEWESSDGGMQRRDTVRVVGRRQNKGISCGKRGTAWGTKGEVASEGEGKHRLGKVRVCRLQSVSEKESDSSGQVSPSSDSGALIRREKRCVPNQKKGRGKVRAFMHRSYPRELHISITALEEAQRTDIEEIGFGCLLRLGVAEIPRHFAHWLVQAFDPISCSLRLDGGAIKVEEKHVQWVLGLPKGGRKSCSQLMSRKMSL